jgi:hypothetical protein
MGRKGKLVRLVQLNTLVHHHFIIRFLIRFMRKILLLSITALSGICSVAAQTYPLFSASENVDIGNIKAAHLVHGDMWNVPGTLTAACEYPKGSGKHIGRATGIWLAGLDSQNTLIVAGQDYRQHGTDYWPGPLDTDATISTNAKYITAQSWAKIWKISWQQIDSFRKTVNHTVSNTPTPILEWPAKGNPYAKGAGGVSLPITRSMAPFVDVNGDNQYNPLHGDYPLMIGDQMLWWVMNDFGPTRTVSGTSPLFVEIQVSAYAYA